MSEPQLTGVSPAVIAAADAAETLLAKCPTCGQTFPEPPCPWCADMTREEATRKLTYILRRLGELDAEVAMHQRLLDEQLEEIRAGHEQTVRPVLAKRQHYEPDVEPLARFLLATDVIERRTVTVPSGAVEFRAGRQRVVKEDEEAAVAWLLGHHLQGGLCVRVKSEVDIAAVTAAFPPKGERFVTEDGEIVPGLRLVEGDEACNVKPAKAVPR